MTVGVGGYDNCDLTERPCAASHRRCSDDSAALACNGGEADASAAATPAARPRPSRRDVMLVHTSPTGGWEGPGDWPLKTFEARVAFVRWLGRMQRTGKDEL